MRYTEISELVPVALARRERALKRGEEFEEQTDTGVVRLGLVVILEESNPMGE